MIDQSRKERFIALPVERRLGNIATNLNRVQVFATKNTPESVHNLVNESVQFIEWTAADVSPEVGEKLVEIQIQLSQWRLRWTEAWNQRQEQIIERTKQMSNEILAMVVN
jgi:GrpB-like predicted nucleotidyltransferase (UPF0157 family)